MTPRTIDNMDRCWMAAPIAGREIGSARCTLSETNFLITIFNVSLVEYSSKYWLIIWSGCLLFTILCGVRCFLGPSWTTWGTVKSGSTTVSSICRKHNNCYVCIMTLILSHLGFCRLRSVASNSKRSLKNSTSRGTQWAMWMFRRTRRGFSRGWSS